MSAAVIGIEILAHYRKEIVGYIQKITHRLRYGRERIVILGAGGVGKTTLGKFLSGEEPLAGERYKDSMNTENFAYKGKVFGTVIVGPGQERRRSYAWPSIRNQIAAGEILGVIFVVAGGYNSLREIKIEDHEVHVADMSSEAFLEAYCEHNRKNEIAILRQELLSWIVDAPRRIFFLTVVLKEDLWWDKKKSVMEHYTNGSYGRVIAEMRRKHGEKDFMYDCVSGSILIENLGTKERLLARTVAGFDGGMQLKSMREILRVISELILDRETQGS